MKKLDWFLIKSFIGPFFVTFFLVIFTLALQFLWVYIDELVGKGLGLGVIFEFLGWAACTLIPMALPLATLLASIMTLGGMGEKNELLAMKAAGISLPRILTPLIWAQRQPRELSVPTRMAARGLGGTGSGGWAQSVPSVLPIPSMLPAGKRSEDGM